MIFLTLLREITYFKYIFQLVMKFLEIKILINEKNSSK